MSGMGWPQWVLIGLALVEFGMVWESHGKPRSPYNIGVHTISVVLLFSLLVAGGFFSGGAR